MLRLNEKEEQIMQVLWRMERAFVKEILAELPEPKPPITTVSSIVRKLEGEGLIGHEAFGKTHRYYPIVKKSEYRRSFFSGFYGQLLRRLAPAGAFLLCEGGRYGPGGVGAVVAGIGG